MTYCFLIMVAQNLCLHFHVQKYGKEVYTMHHLKWLTQKTYKLQMCIHILHVRSPPEGICVGSTSLMDNTLTCHYDL